MRKLKLFFVACALVLGATSMQAKTDITSTYLKDADLSSLTGWGDPGKTAWKTDGAVNVVEFWNWSTEFTFEQEVTMPAGYYRLAVNAFYRNSWGGDGTNNDKAWIFAGEKKQNVVALTGMSELSGYAGSNDLYRAATAFSQGKYSNEFDFNLTEETTFKIGFKGTCPDGGWCILGPVTLWEYTAADYMEDYSVKVAAAEALYESRMGAGVLTALKAAVVDEATLTTVDQVLAAIDNLNEKIAAANTSINSYAALLAAINKPSYTPAFPGGVEKYNDAIATAQGVYDAATIADCTDAISALTNGINAAYEDDYSTFTGYAYDYSTLLSQDLTQWAKSDYVVMTANEHWNGQTGQRYYEQSGADWSSNSWSHEASETPTLPAGNYVMSITARASADVTSTMSVKVGDNDAIIVTLANKGSVGRGVTTDGIGSFADGTYANTNGRGWEYRFIAFTVAEESPVTIKFNSSTNAVQNWVSIASPLLKGDVHPNQIKLNQVKSLVATLSEYEDDIPAGAYATFATDITNANNATVASEDLDDIITALQADIQTAKAVADAYADFKVTKANAIVVANGMESVIAAIDIFAASVEGSTNAESIIEDNAYVSDLTNKYSVWCKIKDLADALVAVDNDNADANTTLANTITTDFNELKEIEVTDRTKAIDFIGAPLTYASAVKTAMKTYVFAANPVGAGAKFDLTFMLTNPDLTGLPTWAPADGWYNDQADGNSQVMTNGNATSEDGTKTYFYEYYHNPAYANDIFSLYQKVTLPVGTYNMSCYAFAQDDSDHQNYANGVYFYANDTQGSAINTARLSEAQIDFVNEEEQEVKIGLKPVTGNKNKWMGIGYVQLFKVPAKSFTISEGAAYDVAQEGAGTVTLTRTIKANTWNTIWLPFSMTESELKTAFGDDVQIAEYEEVADGDNSKINFNVMATPAISPLKPVLLKTSTAGTTYNIPARTIVAGTPTIGGTNFSFVGTTEASTDITAGDYFISSGKLWKSAGATTIQGTRAYLKAKSATARIANFVIGDEATGISEMKVAANDKAIFNLQGQRVKNAQKGLFIQNGKKVIIK